MEVIPSAVDLIGVALIVLASALFIIVAIGSYLLAVYVVKRIRQ